MRNDLEHTIDETQESGVNKDNSLPKKQVKRISPFVYVAIFAAALTVLLLILT